MPNPYAAEDGRFSAGLVRVETRAGTGTWRATANSFIPMPCLTLCDGYSWGVRNYNPRVWFGGPLVKDKVFISQALEYRLTHARIPSLPDPDNLQRSDSFDAFTRVDVHPAAGHALTATVAFFPRRLRNATINTFTPQEVSPDLKSWGYNVALSESATLSPRAVLASFFSASLYDARVESHNDRDMELTVDGSRGGYFNLQQRRTHAYQWSESLTLSRSSRVGDHLLKVGFDVLRSSYSGESATRPVVVRRADGTVSWRQDFAGPTTQRAAGTDVAVYAQDRWRVTPRLLVEPGVRADYDGVLGRTSVSPRLGLVIGVFPPDVGIIRGGVGIFVERTPLNVAAFESFEAATVTRFEADGTTRSAPPVTWTHRALALDTPRAFVWNLEYTHRIGSSVFVKVIHLERTGSREFIVDPVTTAAGHELQLDSRGRSEFRETEVTVRVGQSDDRQVTTSYVRSHGAADLNAYDLYFGTFRQPVVQANEFSVTPVEVPNRLLVTSHRAGRPEMVSRGAARGPGRVPVLADQRGPGVRRRAQHGRAAPRAVHAGREPASTWADPGPRGALRRQGVPRVRHVRTPRRPEQRRLRRVRQPLQRPADAGDVHAAAHGEVGPGRQPPAASRQPPAAS